MDKLWIKERLILDIGVQLDQAREVIMDLMHGLETHKESYRRTVRLGDIDPVNDPEHRVTISQPEVAKLVELTRTLNSLFFSMIEPVTGEERGGLT